MKYEIRKVEYAFYNQCHYIYVVVDMTTHMHIARFLFEQDAIDFVSKVKEQKTMKIVQSVVNQSPLDTVI